MFTKQPNDKRHAIYPNALNMPFSIHSNAVDVLINKSGTGLKSKISNNQRKKKQRPDSQPYLAADLIENTEYTKQSLNKEFGLIPSQPSSHELSPMKCKNFSSFEKRKGSQHVINSKSMA